MATARLAMRKIREILRLKWVHDRTHRETAGSLGISAGVVGSVMSRAQAKGLDWVAAQALDDLALERLLYGRSAAGGQRPLPDPAWIHAELRRSGVTLELLHIEYLERHPDGYRLTAFCDHYRRWRKKVRPSMRQIHRAGEKLFVDYSGKKPEIIDPATGEVIIVELFVAVLGASSYTYAEATLTQSSPDWIASHLRAFEFFGGVTELLVPDQLKSGVTEANRYEPGIQRTYADLARHYDTVCLPARPRKPRDKAKAEVAVQVVQRWILARLRNETFHSLEALNRRIKELLGRLNSRPMKGYGGVSRRDLYERYDKPTLKPLPTERFEFCEWRKARVNIDYHIDVGRHFYSVPHQILKETVEVRLTSAAVEIYHRSRRVASHQRSHRKGGHTTVAEHMPKAHRKHLEWSPSRIIQWGSTIGPNTQTLVRTILDHRPHPEMGYRSCLGILRLARRYGNDRLETACGRALRVGARSYKHVNAILKHGLDQVVDESDQQLRLPINHDNVRGADYYH